MLDQRKLSVLRAIIEDYVQTGEPVGSKTIVERYRLGVSSATVRNDMAVLEEEGYINQPHASAGRIPTDKGYRLFVDRIGELKPLSGAEKRAITALLEGAVDLDDVVTRSVRLLAQLTRQVAVIQYPRLDAAHVRHVELVGLGPSRLLLVLIFDTGRVEQRTFDLGGELDDEQVSDLHRIINEAVVDRTPPAAADALKALDEQVAPELRRPLSVIVATMLESLIERPSDRIVLSGTGNLTRRPLDFPQTLVPVLDALEEQVVLLRLLSEIHDPATINVTIGEEIPDESLRGTAMVSMGYGTGEQVFGALGVVGPTRMDYPGTMGVVSAVARYVGRILAEA